MYFLFYMWVHLSRYYAYFWITLSFSNCLVLFLSSVIITANLLSVSEIQFSAVCFSFVYNLFLFIIYMYNNIIIIILHASLIFPALWTSFNLIILSCHLVSLLSPCFIGFRFLVDCSVVQNMHWKLPLFLRICFLSGWVFHLSCSFLFVLFFGKKCSFFYLFVFIYF